MGCSCFLSTWKVFFAVSSRYDSSPKKSLSTNYKTKICGDVWDLDTLRHSKKWGRCHDVSAWNSTCMYRCIYSSCRYQYIHSGTKGCCEQRSNQHMNNTQYTNTEYILNLWKDKVGGPYVSGFNIHPRLRSQYSPGYQTTGMLSAPCANYPALATLLSAVRSMVWFWHYGWDALLRNGKYLLKHTFFVGAVYYCCNWTTQSPHIPWHCVCKSKQRQYSLQHTSTYETELPRVSIQLMSIL